MGLAQLGERLICIQEVSGSIPLSSTKIDTFSFFKSKIIVLIFFDFLRKEVIQPQVPLRLPCYDFTPVADRTVVKGFMLCLKV